MNTYNELEAELFKLWESGKRPVQIRVEYKWFYTIMHDDPRFLSMVELTDEGPVFLSLPIVFDSWCKTPLIKTVPREQ